MQSSTPGAGEVTIPLADKFNSVRTNDIWLVVLKQLRQHINTADSCEQVCREFLDAPFV